MKFITKLRRDRWRDQVLAVGKQLRAAWTLRSYFAPGEDASTLDAHIDRLTRRRDRLLTNLKETA